MKIAQHFECWGIVVLRMVVRLGGRLKDARALTVFFSRPFHGLFESFIAIPALKVGYFQSSALAD
ncbi:MAG: hypothetical protein AABN95_25120 [Acidobacteriota bacterium]